MEATARRPDQSGRLLQGEPAKREGGGGERLGLLAQSRRVSHDARMAACSMPATPRSSST